MRTQFRPAAAQTATCQDEEQKYREFRELKEELIRNRKENDELRQEIRRLKTMLQNRHLLQG